MHWKENKNASEAKDMTCRSLNIIIEFKLLGRDVKGIAADPQIQPGFTEVTYNNNAGKAILWFSQ